MSSSGLGGGLQSSSLQNTSLQSSGLQGSSLQGSVTQSLLSGSSLQSHLNLGSSSPQSNLGAPSQNLFQQHTASKMGLGGQGGGFGSSALGNLTQNHVPGHLGSLGQGSQSISQQGIGQQGIGQQGISQQGIGQQGIGQQGIGQQGIGQHIMSSANSFMNNFDQNVSLGSPNQYPKDIEDEANAYFQQIIMNKTITITTALEMLSRFQSSSDNREKQVFNCMLNALFEEAKFLHQYPETELKITSKLFGGIIERGMFVALGSVALGWALRIILDSLMYPPGNKMHMFGINALDEFKHKLKDYPQYCRFLKEKNPHYKEFPPRLLEYIDHGEEGQEPPSAKFTSAQGGFGAGIQQNSFQGMFGGQGNQGSGPGMGMFGQNSSSGGLFNNTPPSSSPYNPNQLSSFNLQSILNNSNKGNMGSSLGNIGSSLGANNFNLPPSSSPSPSILQGLGQQGLGQQGLGQQGMGLSGLGQQGMGQSALGQQSMGLSGLGQPVMGQSVLGQQNMGQSVLGHQGIGQSVLGQQGLGQQGLGQPGMGQQAPGQGMVQQGRSTPVRSGTPQGPSWPQVGTELQQPPEKEKVGFPSLIYSRILSQKYLIHNSLPKLILISILISITNYTCLQPPEQHVRIKYQPPPEGVQDKILFIFNNISQDNISQKVRLLRHSSVMNHHSSKIANPHIHFSIKKYVCHTKILDDHV